MHCTMVHKGVSKISSVHHHEHTTMIVKKDDHDGKEKGGAAAGSSPLLWLLHDESAATPLLPPPLLLVGPEPSGIQRNHQLLAKDRVGLGAIRPALSLSNETCVHDQCILLSCCLWSKTSSSTSSLSSSEERGHEQEQHEEDHTQLLLNQAYQIMMLSIQNDDCTLDDIPTKTTMQHFFSETRPKVEKDDTTTKDKSRKEQYRQDLLKDDLRLFQEQLQLSRARCKVPTRIERKLVQRLYQGRR